MPRRQIIALCVVALVTAVIAALIIAPMFRHAEGDSDHGHDAHQAAGRAAPTEASDTPSKSASGDSAAASLKDGKETAATPTSVQLTPQQQAQAGITTETAAAAMLSNRLSFPGEIRLNEDRTAHVVPRVAGVVEEVKVALGDFVRRGQVMAVIASTAVSEQRSELNGALRRLELAKSTYDREKQLFDEKISAQQDFLQSKAALQEAEIAVANARAKLAAIGISASPSGGNRFELRAPFDGYVLEKHVVLGEAVREDTNVYTLSDLSTLWANFNVTAADLGVVRLGTEATVIAPAMKVESTGTVSYVGNFIGESTRTATARVTVANPNGAWRSGLFVSVSIVAAQRQVPVAVPNDAIQTIDGKRAVFVKKGDAFEARTVQIGASDGRRTEIRAGVLTGDEVVTAGSFVLKSELEKGSVEHAH